MVRLLRLASVDDGKFKTSFGNDIQIEPGSKLAVLNATFQTVFNSVNIGGLNNKVQFIASIGDGLSLANSEYLIDPRGYDGVLGISQFFRDVNLAMNGTLGYAATTVAGGAKEDPSLFSEFQMQYIDNLAQFVTPKNPVEFLYTYNVLCSAFGPTWSMAYPQGSRNSPMLVDNGPNTPYFNYSGSGTPTDAQRFSNQIEMAGGVLRQEGTKARAEPGEGVTMSRGSGLWMARVGNFVDNGNAPLQDNGFGIGLSTNLFNLDPEDDIPTSSKKAEVRFSRLTENYKFTSSFLSNTNEQDSGVLPLRVVAAQPIQDHDILWIRVGKNERADQSTANDPTYGKYCIQAGVWQDAGASALEHIFFSHELDGADLQYVGLEPYFFINGQAGDVMIDAMAFTPSTTHLMDVNEETEPDWSSFDPNAPQGYTQTGKDNYQILNILKNGFGTIPLSVIGNIVPQPLNNRFANRTYTTSLVMHSDVWNYLGFGPQFTSANGYDTVNIKMGFDNLEYQNMIKYEGDSGPNLDDDDNFIIESMTLPVDSYDASDQFYADGNPVQKIGLMPEAERLGRRKNIICTIPVSDYNNLVQYEASTPQFIDLRNKSTLNERNLEFRILDKDFNPIQTGTSKSIITLLLAGPGEK